MGFPDKSSDNFAIAMHAFKKNKYNVAASRFYYSLYQACVNEHMKNKKNATDFMSAVETSTRKEALKSHTDAPKWPHDVLIRQESLNDIGLASAEITTVKQLQRLRITGDYGDKDKVVDGDLAPLIGCISDILRKRFMISLERGCCDQG